MPCCSVAKFPPCQGLLPERNHLLVFSKISLPVPLNLEHASRSALTWSLRVEHIPYGAPDNGGCPPSNLDGREHPRRQDQRDTGNIMVVSDSEVWPETGLEEINGDPLEADLWTNGGNDLSCGVAVQPAEDYRRPGSQNPRLVVRDCFCTTSSDRSDGCAFSRSAEPKNIWWPCAAPGSQTVRPMFPVPMMPIFIHNEYSRRSAPANTGRIAARSR